MRFRQPITVFLLVLLAWGLVACGGNTPSSHEDAAIPPPPNQTIPNISATAESAVQVGWVALVNGEPITREAFEEAMARQLPESNAADPQALAAQVLNRLIEQRVIEQAATELGISVSEADVMTEMQALKDVLGDEAAWQAFLTANGFNESEMIAAQYEALLTQRLRDHLMRDLEGDVPQVRARHILVRTEAESNDLLNRLQQGEDFAQLAATFSADLTTRDLGGDLGWFMPQELTDVRLAQIAFELAPNQIAGPIPTQMGYHIIQTLEKAARPIEAERLPVVMENVFTRWLAERMSRAVIERYAEGQSS